MRDLAAGPAPVIDPSALLGRDAPLPGESVVHLDHGVACLEGLEPVDGPVGHRDFLRLRFQDGDTLMLPAAALSRVWRHGPDGSAARLDPLDAEGWHERRDLAVAEIARDARALARRAARRGARPPEPMAWDAKRLARIAEGFPHALTDGQADAVKATLAALRAGRPTERLIVGDVGFGKTEVALRVLAAVALAGGQAALAAPTTILAHQHFETIRRRLEPAGIAVVELSGLSDAEAARAALADGTAQVAVGTHALVSKATTYADLRLVVIDEEHRFGMRHKAALRRLAGGRHLIGMSATPIPQTLAAAQVGLMEVSPLLAPPGRREVTAVRLCARDDAALGAALLRESARGGRSFVVVPRVADIEAAADAIRREAPDLPLAVAHGQMPDAEATAALSAFAKGDVEVLVATTVVENGIDVPEAGTMAVLDANNLGLAQLHQLRGRVGRGALPGRMLLMVTDPSDLSAAAQGRLAALEAAASPGAGLGLALSDAEARGSGELMSRNQAGHLSHLGVGLQRELFVRAIRRAAGEDIPVFDPSDVELADPGRLPDAIADPAQRIALYAALYRAGTPDALDAALNALRKATGPLEKADDEVRALVHGARRRLACRRAGVVGMSLGPKGVALDFADEGTMNDRLAVAKGLGEARRDGTRIVVVPKGDPEELAAALLDALAP